MNKIVGVDYNEGPPVPYRTQKLKIISAEDTWLETARTIGRCQHMKAGTQ